MKNSSHSMHAPKKVKTIRTPFGTRVFHRIVCHLCAKSDHISFIPKENKPVLCRECAELQLHVTDDVGFDKKEEMRECKICKKHILVAFKKEVSFKKEGVIEKDHTLKHALKKFHYVEEELCQECVLDLRAQERKIAYKSIGVHPLLVKKKPKSNSS